MSVQATTLPSGLTVVTHAMAEVETAGIGVWVGAGSRHEGEGEHGLSHLLEHMAFKGTTRRGPLEIAEAIELAGGDLNAATGAEQTSYTARVLAAEAPVALDILADILTGSLFDEGELAREKDVILQEISSVEDNPEDLVFDLFGAAAFPDQPIGRPILGTPKSVKGFSRTKIADYMRARYAPAVTVVAAAGRVAHAELVEAAARLFADLPGSGLPAPPVPAHYTGGEVRLNRRFEQAQIVVGFPGVSFADPASYATHLFANAVGDGMSSRLFQAVREQRGLAYTIDSFHWSYADSGLLGFHAATGAREASELVPVALDCMGSAVHDLQPVELQRAKALTKVALLAALESPGARAEQMARQWLAFGRILTREEIVAKIDAVDLESCKMAGRAALAGPPTLAAIGPVGRVLSSEAVARRLAGV